MANIWDYVQFKPSERPRYTRYELAKLVRLKREEIGLTIQQAASQNNIDFSLWENIENASRAFNVKIYKVISTFLGISIEELLAKEVDDMPISFRSKEINEDINEAILIANILFDEMVMQEKLSAR